MSNKVKILIDKSDLISMAEVVRSATSTTDELSVDELVLGVRDNVGGLNTSDATAR